MCLGILLIDTPSLSCQDRTVPGWRIEARESEGSVIDLIMWVGLWWANGGNESHKMLTEQLLWGDTKHHRHRHTSCATERAENEMGVLYTRTEAHWEEGGGYSGMYLPDYVT